MPAAKQVDVSNSHLRVTNDPPPALDVFATERGIDTWRLVRYLDSDRDLRAACDRIGPSGLLPEKCRGHRVGILPGHRMLWLEGHPVVDGLAHPATLHAAESEVLDSLASAGLPVGRDGGIGRLDQTTTLRFRDPRQGLCFLAGVAAVDVPRIKPAVYGRPPETVYLLAERSGRKLARIYDKGVESGTAPPGALVRLENQTRYGKEARMSAETLTQVPEISAIPFRHRFAPVAASCDGLTAATVPLLAEKVGGRVAAGTMTTRQAERLIGFLILQAEPNRYARKTHYRRRRELREQGLVLANPLTDPIEVDLSDGLDAALAAWSVDG